jgi:predicted DNA binding CopG/RHH family protein
MEKYDKLIENASAALERCKETGSEWGINYWTKVINVLHRQSRQNSQ